MIFDEQIISLVLVTSTAERNNDSNVDKALNNKTGQRSQHSIFLVKQFRWMLLKQPSITIYFHRTSDWVLSIMDYNG